MFTTILRDASRRATSFGLALYHTLYEHRNEQVLLLDDIEHIYKQDVSVGLLRSALWGRKLPSGRRRRMVTYSTSRDLDIADRFEYQGGIIIIGNRVPRKDDPIVQALLTRVPRVQFSVTKDDVYAFMRRVMVKKDGYSVWNGQQGKSIKIPRRDCNQVIDELEKRGVLDLRVFEHALIAWMDFKKKPERLKRELDNVAQESDQTDQSPQERARAIFLAMMENDSLKESKKVELFEERTRGLRPGKAKGYDRATYFRWKQKWGNGEF